MAKKITPILFRAGVTRLWMHGCLPIYKQQLFKLRNWLYRLTVFWFKKRRYFVIAFRTFLYCDIIFIQLIIFKVRTKYRYFVRYYKRLINFQKRRQFDFRRNLKWAFSIARNGYANLTARTEQLNRQFPGMQHEKIRIEKINKIKFRSQKSTKAFCHKMAQFRFSKFFYSRAWTKKFFHNLLVLQETQLACNYDQKQEVLINYVWDINVNILYYFTHALLVNLSQVIYTALNRHFKNREKIKLNFFLGSNQKNKKQICIKKRKFHTNLLNKKLVISTAFYRKIIIFCYMHTLNKTLKHNDYYKTLKFFINMSTNQLKRSNYLKRFYTFPAPFKKWKILLSVIFNIIQQKYKRYFYYISQYILGINYYLLYASKKLAILWRSFRTHMRVTTKMRSGMRGTNEWLLTFNNVTLPIYTIEKGTSNFSKLKKVAHQTFRIITFNKNLCGFYRSIILKNNLRILAKTYLKWFWYMCFKRVQKKLKINLNSHRHKNRKSVIKNNWALYFPCLLKQQGKKRNPFRKIQFKFLPCTLRRIIINFNLIGEFYRQSAILFILGRLCCWQVFHLYYSKKLLEIQKIKKSGDNVVHKIKELTNLWLYSWKSLKINQHGNRPLKSILHTLKKEYTLRIYEFHRAIFYQFVWGIQSLSHSHFGIRKLTSNRNLYNLFGRVFGFSSVFGLRSEHIHSTIQSENHSNLLDSQLNILLATHLIKLYYYNVLLIFSRAMKKEYQTFYAKFGLRWWRGHYISATDAIYIGLKTNTPLLLAQYLSRALKYSKKHRPVIKFFRLMMRHVLMQGLTFIGLRVKINGRLNIHKSKRSVHLYITKKETKMNKINQKVNYALTHAFTKHGVVGIKIWLYYDQHISLEE